MSAHDVAATIATGAGTVSGHDLRRGAGCAQDRAHRAQYAAGDMRNR
jgi:hypothetical protein